MIKILKIACSLLFFFAAITVITLYVQLNTLIKMAITTYGPKITQTTVNVASASLQPFSGKGRIRGLEIGNPKGFKTDSAFRLKDIRVSLEPKSLTSEKIVVHEILIDSPDITYEIAPSGNNLQAIQRNVASYIPSSPPNAKTKKGPEKNVEIDLFILKNAQVHVVSYILGGKEFTLTLPDIRLENIGRKPAGASMKEATTTIFQAITRTVINTATNSSQLLKNTVKSLNNSRQILNRNIHSLFGH